MERIPESCMRMDILKNWEITEKIGAGGYGVVFRVRHAHTGEEAALKWIHIERDDSRGLDAAAFLDAQTNLLNEISVMSKLSDTPEIVSIYDAACQIAPSGNEMDVLIRMELLSPLIGLLQNDGITVEQVHEIAVHVSRALTVCHDRDIIHGDVKPENILKGKAGFKLSDFGVSLSRFMQGQTGAVGTQYFRPPEYDHSRSASKEGDVYSLGMMLYVLFNNGRLPFQTGFSAEGESRAWQEFRNLSLLPDGILPRPQFAAVQLSDVILRAISPRAEERYRTAESFIRDFTAAYNTLDAAQKALLLPYCKSDEFLSEEIKVYLSTGRKTPTFDANPAPEFPKKQEMPAEEKARSEFDIPPEDVKEKEEKKPAAVKQEEPKKPRKRRFVLILPILLLAAACVFAFIRFMPAAFEYDSEISETGAVFTLVNLEPSSFSAKLLPEGSSHEEITVMGENGIIHAKGLVPGTKYTVSLFADKKTVKTEITTLPEKDVSFTPYAQKAYTADAYVAASESFEKMEVTGKLTEAENGKIELRNVSLKEQGMAVFVEFRCVTALSEISSESEIIICVSDPNGNLYTERMTYPPMTVPKEKVRLYYDLSGIFDRMYKDLSKYASGKYTVRMYWLNESVGSLELDVKCEG